MPRWQKLLILLGLGLGLGVAGGAVGLGCRRYTWSDEAYSDKELKKLWKEEAKHLPPPKPEPPLSEHERRVASAIQTIKDMCAMLRRQPLSQQEFAERFGTNLDRYDRLWFRPHDPAFQQPDDSGTDAWVQGSAGPNGVSAVWLHTADDDQLTLADLERAFGKAIVDDPSSYRDGVEFDWEPAIESPLHCQIQAKLRGRFDKPRAPVMFIILNRGAYDDVEGGFWPMGYKVPTKCVFCDGRRRHRAAR